MHKIKADEIHKYYWIRDKKDILSLEEIDKITSLIDSKNIEKIAPE